jgi:hypothetical protein
MNSTRRAFLADVGRGMLLASVGSGLAAELAIGPSAQAKEASTDFLSFGDLEPLVGLMQDTPAAKLQPILVEKIKSGVDLKTLVAAGALANARTFGGQDYVGFHTFMALGPAYKMAQELPSEQAPLPVLKVLYRNATRIQEFGGKKAEVLHVQHEHDDPGPDTDIQAASRAADFGKAENAFAAYAKSDPGEAFNHLEYALQDEVDVHRVVLAWRAWETHDLTGREHAHTLLRQSVRYCVKSEQGMCEHHGKEKFEARIKSPSHIRQVLPRLLDEHKLLSGTIGTRQADDAWIEATSLAIANGTQVKGAETVASALAEGFSLESVSEAISLAANSLLLRNGKERAHGDSTGVHASDSAIAWRNIALVSDHRNRVASLIVAGFHTAGQSQYVVKEAYPLAAHLEKVTSKDPAELLKQVEGAIRENDQATACAAVAKYGSLGNDSGPVFELLLRYGISEDGRLHAEKYYRTACEEFALMRPAFRWRQLQSLARVTASEYNYDRFDKKGFHAPGYEEACKLLGVA